MEKRSEGRGSITPGSHCLLCGFSARQQDFKGCRGPGAGWALNLRHPLVRRCPAPHGVTVFIYLIGGQGLMAGIKLILRQNFK